MDIQRQIDEINAKLERVNQVTFLDPISQNIIRNFVGTNQAFPIGGIFISVVSTNPATLLGYGTWTAFGAGKVLVGLDSGDTDFDTVEETGGAKTHTLTVAEMPSHSHETDPFPMTPQGGSSNTGYGPSSVGSSTFDTGLTGGGGAHNNLQPYITVFMWKRTA